MSPTADNLRVFISYSHDSPQHKDRVLALSDRLRADGIDCSIDQYETSPPEGWARWCDRMIEEARFVLVACTKTYEQRFKGADATEIGKGVKWEGAIITQELYEAQARNKKFIPIIFTDEDTAYIPMILRGVTSYKIFTEEGYDSLYRHLTIQPLTPKPELGKRKSMPPRERKQEASESEMEQKTKEIWNIPFPRNPYFTGREQLFEKLLDALKSGKIQVIKGLGGMGKTQTAVEYAFRYKTEYNAVLWSKADFRDAIISGFAALAQKQVLDLPEKDEKDQNKIVEAVCCWLNTNQEWLLILDNADDPSVVVDFIPQNINGHILLTSRADDFDIINIEKPEEIKKMTPDEAQEFLQKRTGTKEPSKEEKKALSDIVIELDYLPLALEQAGAYIKKIKCSFSTYLSSYRGRGLKLLSQSPPVAGKYPESVATTWLLNFDMVEKANKASADLLKFSAFLSPDNIPLELLAQGAPQLGELIQEALSGIKDDPLLLDELLMPLTQYSLINRDTVLNTYSIHRLVQLVIRDRMKKDELRMWAERAVRAVNLVFPVVEFKNWPLIARVMTHALVCAGFIDEWDFEFEDASRLLNQVGVYQYHRAEYVEAENFYKRALTICEKTLGADHPDVALSLNNLAQLLQATNRLAEAEPLMRRALSIFEESFGQNHPDVATNLNNLTHLLQATNRLAEAEPLMRRALTIDEQSFGQNHPNVARDLNNLAHLLQATNRLAEAEPLMRRALTIDETSFGQNHPNVAIRLNNLALLLKATNRLAEAEPLMRRVVEIFLRFTHDTGHPHPHLQAAIDNYASLLQAMGNSDENIRSNISELVRRFDVDISGQMEAEPSPELRAVIEQLMSDPSKIEEIGVKLQKEDPALLLELVEWIKRQQQK